MQWNYRGGNIATSWQKLWRNRGQTGKQELREARLKKKKKAGQKLLGLPFISSSPRRPGNVLLLPHSCIEEQCIPCQHSHCSSQHQAERSMGCYKTYHLCLGLSGNVLLQLQVQPQRYRWRGEKQDCAITRILHPPSSSSAKSSPSGSAAPTCKS